MLGDLLVVIWLTILIVDLSDEDVTRLGVKSGCMSEDCLYGYDLRLLVSKHSRF